MPKEGIAPDLAAFMRLFRVAQKLRNLAFRNPATDRARQKRQPALKRSGQCIEHPGRNVRHASHDEDIAMPDARRARHAIGNELGTIGYTRHAQARFGDPATGLIITVQRGARFGMNDNTDPEGRSNGINRDIVMRRPDAASREEIIVARAQDVDRLDNGLLHIWHDAHFGQPYALDVQPERDLRNILVLRAPRENFIANDDKSGGPDACRCHAGCHSAEARNSQIPQRLAK